MLEKLAADMERAEKENIFFENLREIGAQHLEERQKDFKRDGWAEV